jgi:hypothetical protein
MRAASSNRVATVLALSLAALLVTGCSDEPLAPSAVAGTYVLFSIDGNPLPAPAGYQGPADGPVIVIADTLRLDSDGSGSIVRVQQTDYNDPNWIDRLESTLHYETTAGGIAMTLDCPPGALMLCIAGPHLTARLVSTELTATRLLGSQKEELVYARVDRLD